MYHYPKLKTEGAAGRLPHLPSFSREEATRLDACSRRSVVYAFISFHHKRSTPVYTVLEHVLVDLLVHVCVLLL
jgi:hypothetical protein